jgi:hypothetical protein
MTWVLALIAIGGWVFAMHFHASAMRAFSGWQRALDGWEESDKLSDEDEQRYETLWGWYNRAYGDVWAEKWAHCCTVFAACAALHAKAEPPKRIALCERGVHLHRSHPDDEGWWSCFDCGMSFFGEVDSK